jgi:hypothetical protein
MEQPRQVNVCTVQDVHNVTGGGRARCETCSLISISTPQAKAGIGRRDEFLGVTWRPEARFNADAFSQARHR